MNIDINSRQNELTQFESYLNDVNTEITMILQNLQWDRKHLDKTSTMVVCQYDSNHRVPLNKLVDHEKRCFLKSQGYEETDILLPSPIDLEAATLVNLNAESITEIIKNAADKQTNFKRGAGSTGHEPLTLERLQATYTADERRAIHDAVVNRVPSCHDLSDLALLSTNEEAGKGSHGKTRLEILAELRDMRRRRTKYRVAAKSRNYSDVLRDVIACQMDLYSQAQDNATHQVCIRSSSDSKNKRKDNERSKEKCIVADPQSAASSTDERQCSTVTTDTYKPSRHSTYQQGYEKRKSQHSGSDDAYISANYSKTRNSEDLAFTKTDYYKDKYGSTSKRRDDGYTESLKGNKERRKYYDYESRKRHRDGKDYESRRNTRAEEHSVTGSKHKTKDRRSDCEELKEKYYHHKQHRSKNKDEHANRKLSPTRRDGVDKQYRHDKNTHDSALKD